MLFFVCCPTFWITPPKTLHDKLWGERHRPPCTPSPEGPTVGLPHSLEIPQNFERSGLTSSLWTGPRSVFCNAEGGSLWKRSWCNRYSWKQGPSRKSSLDKGCSREGGVFRQISLPPWKAFSQFPAPQGFGQPEEAVGTVNRVLRPSSLRVKWDKVLLRQTVKKPLGRNSDSPRVSTSRDQNICSGYFISP